MLEFILFALLTLLCGASAVICGAANEPVAAVICLACCWVNAVAMTVAFLDYLDERR